mmetsp:Transcript_56538/g.84034  ORF Transcript_56538/g.84034 Transcript_56538/m.84034 type:complete len:113 (-) Transcript_56538:547-885(-)
MIIAPAASSLSSQSSDYPLAITFSISVLFFFFTAKTSTSPSASKEDLIASLRNVLMVFSKIATSSLLITFAGTPFQDNIIFGVDCLLPNTIKGIIITIDLQLILVAKKLIDN